MDLDIQNFPLHNIITLAFYAVAFLYVLFSAILYYHWNEYSVEPTVTKTTLTFYFISTIPLVVIMGIMVLII
ncbi:MAG: hypothetical protein R3B60_02920 [Candidatus Paceibacterota bacterium]